jgi:hypothetical protein
MYVNPDNAIKSCASALLYPSAKAIVACILRSGRLRKPPTLAQASIGVPSPRVAREAKGGLTGVAVTEHVDPGASADVETAFRRMLLMRRFDERVLALHDAQAFAGHFHVYFGQEATGAAA